MRSRTDAPWRAALMLAATLGVTGGPAGGATEAERPTEPEIAVALEAVKSDPNLTTERTMRTLKWASELEERDDPTPRWLRWLLGFFDWMAEAGRAFLWMVAVLLIGLLALYVFRIARARGWGGAADRFVAPSHVGELDIRPESLPADIGGAALALWERGEHRAALALLYRGLLSRLAHVHAVPIRDSSTERECLVLAVGHLHADRTPYVSRLVSIWQRAVYGGSDPHTHDVRSLCEEFAAALDAQPVAGALAQSA